MLYDMFTLQCNKQCAATVLVGASTLLLVLQRTTVVCIIVDTVLVPAVLCIGVLDTVHEFSVPVLPYA
jgi:hypothetical protein